MSVIRNKNSKSHQAELNLSSGGDVSFRNDNDNISVELKIENNNRMRNTEIGIPNVRTESVLLSGSAGSGLSYLAIGVAQKVIKLEINNIGKLE